MQCRTCQRFHCDLCIKRVKAGQGELLMCAQPHCHGLLKVGIYTVPPTEAQLRDVVLRVMSIEGLLTAIALAAPSWIAHVLFFIPGIFVLHGVSLAGVTAYYFLLANHIGL